MLLRITLICSLCLAATFVVVAQSHRRPRPQEPARPAAASQPRTQPSPSPEPVSAPAPEPEQSEPETLKIDTNLVTVPVVATTREGNYLTDLRQDEFNVSEDGVAQDVAFFATVSAPFHVVLMLDTSASTQEKLGLIQRAAVAFVEQLQAADRVKVISFDTVVHDLSEFTNDRAVLKGSIYQTRSGQGTKLYDAFEVALGSLKSIEGRKAIVLFTDGVDWHSDRATFDTTLHWLDEQGVIVYPIRYDTRAETERIARGEMDDPANSLPTIGVIRKSPSGTTAPTFPSDDPNPVPTGGQAKTGPFGLPTAGEIMRGRRQRQPDTDRSYPDRVPGSGPDDPRDRGNVPMGRSDPNDPRPNDSGSSTPFPRGSRRRDDSISGMLDQMYLTADSYLTELATKSGGRLLRADTVGSLPDAFAKIAAELRTQYTVGYYPTNKNHDGQYRKIKVSSTRKNVAVRARPGYRAPSGG
jgi:hypothetical protein